MTVRLNPCIEQNVVQPIIENQMSWADSLPQDLFGVIFSHLTLLKIQESACVNKYWNVQIVNSVKTDKISSLNSQISKMSELVKEQLGCFLTEAKLDQSKDLKTVISSTLEMRKKILVEVQKLNNPLEIKDYLEGIIKEAMDHNRLDQAMEALNLIQCDKLQTEAFTTIAGYFCQIRTLHKLPKWLEKLNNEQAIQFNKHLANYRYRSNIKFNISSSIKSSYNETITLNHFETLINASNFLNIWNKNENLEMLSEWMKNKGFLNEGYKLECDLFENHLPSLLEYLSIHGHFNQATAIVNGLIFINKAEYQTSIKIDLYDEKQKNLSQISYYACKLAKIGYDTLALMLADLLPNDEKKYSCREYISIELLKKGYLDKAIKIAIQIPAHFYKEEELSDLLILTKNLAINGFQEKAYEIANSLAYESDKAFLLEHLESLTSKNQIESVK